jgi:hypothetical protein
LDVFAERGRREHGNVGVEAAQLAADRLAELLGRNARARDQRHPGLTRLRERVVDERRHGSLTVMCFVSPATPTISRTVSLLSVIRLPTASP